MADPAIKESEREALKNRQLPEMQLSDGSPASNTAAPPPFPEFASPQEAALYRFQVQGNAIVTGGGGTLSLSSARALLEHGLQGLCLWDLKFSPQAKIEIEDLQKKFPDKFITIQEVNTTKEDEIKTAMLATLTAFKIANLPDRLDHMLCFAGVVGCVPSLDIEASEFRRVMSVNAEGTWLCTRAAGQQMSAQSPSGGSLVLISSISAHAINYPQPQMPYNISKAAVSHMAKCLAAEWAVFGIRTNAICPGYQNTILNEGAGLERARNMWTGRNPMGRMGEPQELQGLVVLLSSRAGSYMNGGDYIVDGGGTVF